MADVPKVELAPFTGGADADGVEAKEKAAKAAKHLKLFATRNEMGSGISFHVHASVRMAAAHLCGRPGFLVHLPEH